MMNIFVTEAVANFKLDIGRRFPELLADIDGETLIWVAMSIVAKRAGFRKIEGHEQIPETLKELTAHINDNYRRAN